MSILALKELDVRFVAAGATKMSQRALMISVHSEKPTFLGPLWPLNPVCVSSERIKNMVIATLLFLGFIVATGAGIVKAYEWHQDVLYGPYLKRID